MNNQGILKRDKDTRKVTQYLDDLTYLEALLEITNLREKHDGYYYWIGKVK